MRLPRRHLLAAAGATLALSGGLLRVAAAQTAPGADPATAHPDPRVRAAGHAIRAPNPHNRQPWLLSLVGADEVVLRCDLDRRLPDTDPFDRQILIGLGGFLELYRMALAEEGIGAEIAPFPEGLPGRRLDRRPIATIRLRPGAGVRDPLFAAVATRRSAKMPYDTARVPDPAALAAVLPDPSRFGAATDPARVAALRDLAIAAFRIEAGTPHTLQESVDLMRLGAAEIAANPDGIGIGGPQVEAMLARGLLTRDAFADRGSQAHAMMVQVTNAAIAATPCFVWTTTRGNGRVEQLSAGRDWLRLDLAANAAGLGIHPLSQALQEFPEMEPMHEAMRRETGVAAGERLQMFGRLGRPSWPGIRLAPRWPAESRILRG
jgi:hypothetical protein